MKKPEILAPAGDFTSLQAALDAGADAVYFGLDAFNMRARASANFRREDLPEIAARCRARGVKRYLALNTIVYEDELDAVDELVRIAKPHVDAFIVSDWGVIARCRKHGVKFHCSTQMSTSNSAAVEFLAAQGAERVVLARECTLDEVARIVAAVPGTEIECFVHGAQCVAESGRCFMSHEAFGASACRGECHQPCRRAFLVKAVDFFTDDAGKPIHESDTAFTVTPHTVLSAKDLCSLPFVDKLMSAGIASFKIEGRARNPEYVKTVTAAYRRAVDAVAAGAFSPALAEELTASVKTVFHREFSCGLYFGRPGKNQFTDVQNSSATQVKRHVGVVLDYFLKAGVAQVQIQDASVKTGDVVQIHGPTTGVQECTIVSLRRDDAVLETAERGNWATFPAPRCRVGDKVFLIERR
ncbi:MAG: U32 family peptidase [Kiritimatiellae bacterium]|nr:U32 family peptidase [Kiritimatiellia bacterium]